MPGPDSAIARRVATLLMLAGLAALAAGCRTSARDTTGSIPQDYRARHPIAIKEGDRTLALFVGPGRGGLNPMQRAEVLAFAQTWKREATGGVTIHRPVRSPNERAANDTLKEVLSILAATGIPHHGIGITTYHPAEGRPAPLRLKFPQMVAEAGPCGLWPDDLGPSNDLKHFDNQPYYNLGCATQRNLAAMVAEPADLVQPRGETPPYAAKRTGDIDRWSRGTAPAKRYPTYTGITPVGQQ